MKKNAGLIFTRILYVLFTIGTIISLFIVYRDIDNSFVFKFLIAYMFFVFFMLLYIPFITVLNSRRFKWVEIRKRLIRFGGLFILFGASNYLIDYFFRPSNIDLFRTFSSAFGVSFGISFIDVIFLKNKKK